MELFDALPLDVYERKAAYRHSEALRSYGHGRVLSNWTVIAVGTKVLGANLLLMQFIAAGVVVVANLVISTLWVFADA
jgi:hypothetical protein